MGRRTERDKQGDWVLHVRAGDRHVLSDMVPVVRYEVSDRGDSRLDFHMHEDMEVGLCLAGQTERHIGGAVFLARPGDVWMCGMWEPHAWLNTTGFARVHFYLPLQAAWSPLGRAAHWLSMFTAPVEQRPRVNTTEMREAVLAIGAEMAREFQERRRGWQELGWAAVVRLLVTLERGWSPPEDGAGPSSSHPSDVARVLPALALTQASLERAVSVEEAAAACGLSPSRFRTVFRHTMGISYGRYGVRARVASAASRLLAGNAPIETVAQQTGFTDRSHLARMFVAFQGCTPAEFRRRNTTARA